MDRRYPFLDESLRNRGGNVCGFCPWLQGKREDDAEVKTGIAISPPFQSGSHRILKLVVVYVVEVDVGVESEAF